MTTPENPDAWLLSYPADKEYQSAGTDSEAWNGRSLVHHAEPLYTLPNALRALADDADLPRRLAELRNSAPNQCFIEDGSFLAVRFGLNALADELENPEPPIPPEPTGDVVVFDREGSLWNGVENGRDHWWASDAHEGGWDWRALVLDFGPLKAYRAEP